MRILIGSLLVLYSALVQASCGGTLAYIENEKVQIEIFGDDCTSDPRDFIYFSVKGEYGEFGKKKRVPFLSECSRTKTGFKCRPNGRTPLAGATYKFIQFGRSDSSCSPDDYLEEKYICIKGCNNPDLPFDQQIIPEYLIGHESC